jgi:uncharacterized Zn-finger protein
MFSGFPSHKEIFYGEESSASSASSFQWSKSVECAEDSGDIKHDGNFGVARSDKSPLPLCSPQMIKASTNTQLILCEYCDASFASASGLRRHVNGVHLKRFPFTCDLCGKGFNLKVRLQDHLALRHGAVTQYVHP